MIKRLMLRGLVGMAVGAAMSSATAQQGSLVHTPITDPAALLAGRSNPAAPVSAGMPDSSFDIDNAGRR